MHDRCSDIIRDIVERIDNGEFRSETDVRRGIVDPLLEKLRWPLRRPRVVEREYPVEGGRVDYALCDQKEPLVFIEAKRPEGISDASRQQLFRYCAAHGVPMAVLTDGGTWNFFLPLRKGTLDERSLHPIALSADPTEACRVLHRYLQHVAVTSGKNIDAATRDLEHMRFERACESVWRRVVERPADDFVAMFAKEIRSEAAIDPSPDAVAHWLRARAAGKPWPPEPAPPKATTPTADQFWREPLHYLPGREDLSQNSNSRPCSSLYAAGRRGSGLLAPIRRQILRADKTTRRSDASRNTPR